MEGLLLGEIVARANLNRVTTRYVLSRAAEIGVSAAPGQGRHRRFNGSETVRLATCARLVMHGVPLDKAVEITNWSESYWLGLTRGPRQPKLIYETFVGTPWRFRLINGRYVQLRQDRRRSMRENDLTRDEDEYFDLVDEAWVNHWDLEEHLPELSWNMTMLAMRLVAETANTESKQRQSRRQTPKL